MYNNIRTDSEIHKFINSEFRNDRLRLEWPLATETYKILSLALFLFFGGCDGEGQVLAL